MKNSELLVNEVSLLKEYILFDKSLMLEDIKEKRFTPINKFKITKAIDFISLGVNSPKPITVKA
jgi:hypothetical protein